MAFAVCDRCGIEASAEDAARRWSKFEALKEDGETLRHVTVCPDCLTDAEEADASPISRLSGGR
jgi:hypothetical protein